MAKQSILFSFDSATNRFKPLALIGSQTEAYTESNPIPESVFDNFAYTANYTCYIKNGRAKGLPENEAYVTYTVNKSDATGSGSQEALVVGPDTMKTPRRFMRKSGFIDGAKKWGPWEELMTSTNIGSSSVLNRGVFVDGNVLSEPRGTMNFQASTSNLSALNLEGRGATWVHLSHFAHANNGYAFQMAAKIYNGDPTTTNDEKNWGMKLRATIPTGTSWGPWHNVVSYPEDDNTGVFGYRTVGDWNLLNSGTLMIGAGKGAGQKNSPISGTDDNGLVLPMFYTNKKKGVQLWYATENEPMGYVRILNNSRWSSWRKIFDMDRMFFTQDGVVIKSNVITNNVQVREPSGETEPLYLNKYLNNPVAFKYNGKYITLQSLEDRFSRVLMSERVNDSNKDILNAVTNISGERIYSGDFNHHAGLPSSNRYGRIIHFGWSSGYTAQLHIGTLHHGDQVFAGTALAYIRNGKPRTTTNEWGPWHEIGAYPMIVGNNSIDEYVVRATDWNLDRIRKYFGIEHGKSNVKNSPDPSETSGAVMSIFRQISYGTQLHFSTNYNRLYLRSIHGGTWKPWVKIADGDRLNFLNNGVIIRDDLQVEKIDGYKNSAFVDLLLNTKGDKHVKFKAGGALISLQNFYDRSHIKGDIDHNIDGGTDANNMIQHNAWYLIRPLTVSNPVKNGPDMWGTMHVGGYGNREMHQIAYSINTPTISYRYYVSNESGKDVTNDVSKWSKWYNLNLSTVMHTGSWSRQIVTDLNNANKPNISYVYGGNGEKNIPTRMPYAHVHVFGDKDGYFTQIAMSHISRMLAVRYKRMNGTTDVDSTTKYSPWSQIVTANVPTYGKILVGAVNETSPPARDLSLVDAGTGIDGIDNGRGMEFFLDGISKFKLTGNAITGTNDGFMFSGRHFTGDITNSTNKDINLNTSNNGRVNFKSTTGQLVSLQDFYNSAVKTSSTNVQTITDANLAIEPNVTYFIVSGGGTNKNLPPDLQDDVFITVYKSGDNLVQTLLVNKNDTGKPVMYFRSKNYRGTVWQEWYRSSEVVPLTLDEFVPNLEDDNDDALEQVSGLLEKFKTLQADNVYSYFMLVNEPAFFRKCEEAMAPRDDHNYEVESSLKGAIPADATDLTNGGSMLFEHHQTEPNVAMQKVTLTNKQGVITGIYTRGTNTVGSKPTLGQWTKILPVATNQSGGTGTMTVKECVNLNTTKDIGFYKLTEAGYLTIPQNLRPELNSGFGDPYPFLEVYTKDGLVYQRISTMDGDDPSSGIYTLERFGGLSSHDGRFSWAEWNIKEGIKYAKPEDMIQGYGRLEPRGMAEFSRKFVTTSMSPFILHIDNHEFFRAYGRELAKPSPVVNIPIFPFDTDGTEVDSTPANKVKAAKLIENIVACTIENHRSSHEPDLVYQKMLIYYKKATAEYNYEIDIDPITFERTLSAADRAKATNKILSWVRLTPVKNPKTLNYNYENRALILSEDPTIKTVFKETGGTWVNLQKMYEELQAVKNNSGGGTNVVELNFSNKTPQEIADRAFGKNILDDFDLVVSKEPGRNFAPSAAMMEVIRQLDRKLEGIVHGKTSPIRTVFRNDDSHTLKIENRRYIENKRTLAVFMTLTMLPRGSKIVLSQYDPSGIYNSNVNWNVADVYHQGNRLVESDTELLLNANKSDTVAFTHTDGTKHTLQELFQSAADGKGLFISGLRSHFNFQNLTSTMSWGDLVTKMGEGVQAIRNSQGGGTGSSAKETFLRKIYKLEIANELLRTSAFSPKPLEMQLNEKQSTANSACDEIELVFDEIVDRVFIKGNRYLKIEPNKFQPNIATPQNLVRSTILLESILEDLLETYFYSPFGKLQSGDKSVGIFKTSLYSGWYGPSYFNTMNIPNAETAITHYHIPSLSRLDTYGKVKPHSGYESDTDPVYMSHGQFIVISGAFTSLYIRQYSASQPGDIQKDNASIEYGLNGFLINTRDGAATAIDNTLLYRVKNSLSWDANLLKDFTIIYLPSQALNKSEMIQTESSQILSRTRNFTSVDPVISIKGLRPGRTQSKCYVMSFGFRTHYSNILKIRPDSQSILNDVNPNGVIPL